MQIVRTNLHFVHMIAKCERAIFFDFFFSLAKRLGRFHFVYDKYASAANIIAIGISDCAGFNCCAHEKPINYSSIHAYIYSFHSTNNRNLHLIPYFNMFHIGIYNFRYIFVP